MRALERKPQRQLNGPGVRGGQDLAKRPVIDIGIWVAKFRMVENVEKLRAKFKLQTLTT
jgi:hypothetical protein